MTMRSLLLGVLLCTPFTRALSQLTEEAVPLKRPSASSPVGQCRTEVARYQGKATTDLRVAGTPLTSATMAPITTEARRLIRACADKLVPESLKAEDLSELATLYISSGDTAKARQIAMSVLAKPALPETQRAAALLVTESLAIASFDAFLGFNREAERIIAQIDALSDAALPQKIEAHTRLLGRYDYADVDEGLAQQAAILIELGKRALKTHVLGMTEAFKGSPSVDAAYAVMTTGYSSRARAAGDLLHADSALKILDEARRVVSAGYPVAENEFESARKMYRLVGTRATPIEGKWWVNNPGGATFTQIPGKVSLIQFTAHWCGPCKHSYPGMLAIVNHFAGRPFESVMATSLYGFFESRQRLTPEQEVAADQAYYATENHLPMKVAINPPLAQNDTITNDNDRRYAVNGIPQVLVVDKQGVIRAAVVGWDNLNEKRLIAFIEKLLAEK